MGRSGCFVPLFFCSLAWLGLAAASSFIFFFVLDWFQMVSLLPWIGFSCRLEPQIFAPSILMRLCVVCKVIVPVVSALIVVFGLISAGPASYLKSFASRTQAHLYHCFTSHHARLPQVSARHRLLLLLMSWASTSQDAPALRKAMCLVSRVAANFTLPSCGR